MKIIIISILTFFSILAAKDTSLKYPIENFGSAIQWNLFYDEFEISGDIGYCNGGKQLKAYDFGWKTAIGFKTRIIEPVAIVETTNTPWFFVFLGMNLGKSGTQDSVSGIEHSSKFIDFNNSRQDKESTSTPFRDAHIFRFPIFGMILKSNSMLCFDQGKISPLHFSELDPRWHNDIISFKFNPLILSMLNPMTMAASILDCLAATASQGLDHDNINPVLDEGDPGFLQDDSEFGRARVNDNTSNNLRNKAINAADTVRNTMFWSNGCVIGNVGSTTGWLPSGSDPLAGTTTLLHRLVNFLHVGGLSENKTYGFKKSTNITYAPSSSLPNNVSSMCAERKFPMIIKSQYKFQLGYPMVGKGTELGVTPPVFTTLKNVPGSQDDVAYFLWKKRDFFAGAYACNGSNADDE